MSLIEKLRKDKRFKDQLFETDNTPQEYISTGSLSLNVLFSGKLDGGIPAGKISSIASPSSLGKSFIGLKIVKNAIKMGYEVIYIDTEFAYSEQFATNIGIDLDSLMVIQDNGIETVQRTLTTMMSEFTKEEKKKLLIVIDSWDGFTTTKTREDAESSKDAVDMTISKKKNSLSRLMTGFQTTIFVVNRTYENIMDMYNPLKLAGGNGLLFACSSIVMGSSKAKKKESSGEITGALVTASTKKSRFCKENTKLKYLIRYDGGIDPYFGLLEDALEGGYLDKPSMGWYSRPCVEGDKKTREKDLYTADFWRPIITDTDFKEYIERKYTFTFQKINDLELDI